jgi:hypothetical protein
VWPVPLAQVWSHYKIGKLNMWTLFCNVCIHFLNSQIWKEIMLELNWIEVSIQVLPRSQLISPSKTWFFGIYLEFQPQKITLKSISPTFWIQILPNKFH